jgi:hypothetical protein
MIYFRQAQIRFIMLTIFGNLLGMMPFTGGLYAEPAPQGIMVFENKCSPFWPGDECVSYTVPTGWTAIFPHEFKDQVISYHGKRCVNLNSLPIGKPWEESCCVALGLIYEKTAPGKKSINQSLSMCKGR